MRRNSILAMLLAVICILVGCSGGAPDTDNEPICVDHCGDGQCQALVCLGSDCPCAESAESCPSDCTGTDTP